MPLSREQAIKLMKGPFGEATLKEVSKFAFPICWVSPGKTEPGPFTNGTMFLVDFGKGVFAVTANHVFEGYRADKEKFPDTHCMIFPSALDGGSKDAIPFDPEERLIDRLADPDIATFEILDSEASLLGTSKISLWPPLIPEEGGGVAFAGFPGHERIFEPPATFNFAPYPALTIATSVSERQISCQIEREYMVQSPGFGEPPLGYDFGGMSGGPLFNTVERGGVLIWYLGGVLKEGHADLEILTASRADFILRDGALRH